MVMTLVHHVQNGRSYDLEKITSYDNQHILSVKTLVIPVIKTMWLLYIQMYLSPPTYYAKQNETFEPKL